MRTSFFRTKEQNAKPLSALDPSEEQIENILSILTSGYYFGLVNRTAIECGLQIVHSLLCVEETQKICQLNGCIYEFFKYIEERKIDKQTNLEAVSRSKQLDYCGRLDLLLFPCPRPFVKASSTIELGLEQTSKMLNEIYQPVGPKIQMVYQSRMEQFLGEYEFYADEWASSIRLNSSSWSLKIPETNFSEAPESLQKKHIIPSFHLLVPPLRKILQPTVKILSGRAYHIHKQLLFNLLVRLLIQYETILRDCVTAVDEVNWYEPTLEDLAIVKRFIDKYEDDFVAQEKSDAWNWVDIPVSQKLSDDHHVFVSNYCQWLISNGEDESQRMWSLYQKCLKAFLSKSSSYLAQMHRNKCARELQEI